MEGVQQIQADLQSTQKDEKPQQEIEYMHQFGAKGFLKRLTQELHIKDRFF